MGLFYWKGEGIMLKERMLNKIINFIVSGEEASIDFSDIVVAELTTSDGQQFLQIISNHKSAVFCLCGDFLSLVINEPNVSFHGYTYHHLKHNSQSKNITNLFRQMVCNKIAQESTPIALGQIIKVFGVGQCKINALGNKNFIVKTANEKNQFCGYVQGKLCMIEVPNDFVHPLQVQIAQY